MITILVDDTSRPNVVKDVGKIKKRSSKQPGTALRKLLLYGKAYMGTMSLLVSSFQVTIRYQTIITAKMSSRVGPYPRASGR